MLLPELLKEVLGALSRDDLEVLMRVNKRFLEIIQRDFAKGPFRLIDDLKISGHDRTEFRLVCERLMGEEESERLVYKTTSAEKFGRRVNMGRVASLRYVGYACIPL